MYAFDCPGWIRKCIQLHFFIAEEFWLHIQRLKNYTVRPAEQKHLKTSCVTNFVFNTTNFYSLLCY